MRIVLLATTDLSFDQRLQRISSSLAGAGHDVLLLGRVKPGSPDFQALQYKSHRFKTWFWKGKLFYLEINIRFVLYLLGKPFDVVTANDADTLLAAWLLARLKKKKLAFDAHEYFSEVPELIGRNVVKKIWQWIENMLIPSVELAYTPGSSLANLFAQKYGVPFAVVRNMPWKSVEQVAEKRAEIPLKLIYSGAVNVGRGLHELIDAAENLPVHITIAGFGDILTDLQKYTSAKNVAVTFPGYLKPDKLRLHIEKAQVGVNLLSTNSLSYHYSLANKFFDYVQAGIPQICVNYPEYEALNREFEVALLVNANVDEIRKALVKLMNEPDTYQRLVNNCKAAAQVWNWDEEQKKLIDCYQKLQHSPL